MVSSIQETLDKLRDTAENDSALGRSFEHIAKIFFEYDATQQQQYSNVWRYEDRKRSAKTRN